MNLRKRKKQNEYEQLGRLRKKTISNKTKFSKFNTDNTGTEIENCTDLIYSGYGIRLNWSEIFGLTYYLECFKDKCHKEHKEPAVYDMTLHLFMINYFDFNCSELGDKGAKLLNEVFYAGTPEFKKYCGGHVDQWRDERNLI